MDSSKIIICTIADSRYLAQVRVLYESIIQHEKNFSFHVLCMDSKLKQNLRDFDINCHMFSDIGLKSQGEGKEKFFYATPAFISFLLNTSNKDLLYVDADSEFFAPVVSHCYELLTQASTLMVFHGYRDKLAFWHLRDYGDYNVGFNFFKNDSVSKIIVKDWLVECQRYFNGNYSSLSFFSDQIYLNDWLSKYGNYVKVIFNSGINISPRVIAKFSLKKVNGNYYCGNVLVRHVHYIDVRKKGDVWQSGFHNYLRRVRGLEKKFVLEYIAKLEKHGYVGSDTFALVATSSYKRVLAQILWKINGGILKWQNK